MNPMLKRALGIIFAEQHGANVALYGVKVGALQTDIMRMWSTSRIEANMFTTFKSTRIEFPAFFAPDVHYILQTLLTNPGRARVTSKSAHLRQALISLQQETWLKQLEEPIKSILDRSRTKLFHKTPLEHQAKFYEVYERNTQRYNLQGYLLSARPGAGKTLTGLMLAEMVHADKIVIICPKNAVHRVWAKACREEYKQAVTPWVTADGKDYNNERVIIAHYEDLEKVIKIAGKLTGNVFIDLDECHNFNDPDSLRTQRFIQLCKMTKAKHVVWASGTPIKAMGYEAVPMLRTIDPLFTSDVEQRFRRIFGKEAKRALDILRNRMGLLTYKVETLGEVNTRDEPITLPPIKVKLPDGAKYTVKAIQEEMKRFIEERTKYYEVRMKQYQTAFDEMLELHEKTLTTTAERDTFRKYVNGVKVVSKSYDPVVHKELVKFLNQYEKKQIIPSLPQSRRNEFKDTRSVIKYAKLKIMGEALGGVLGSKRSLVHQEMIEHAGLEKYVDDAQTKTLIFTSYVPVVEKLGAYFKARKYDPILVYGATNNNLDAMLTKFEKDDKLNPAIATYMSLSTAVPMTMASTAIFFDAPFRDHILTQAKARLDRLGQTAQVSYVHVFLDTGDEPNISTRANDILAWSRQQVAAIMGTGEGEDLADSLESIKEDYADSISDDHYTGSLEEQADRFDVTDLADGTIDPAEFMADRYRFRLSF